MLRWEGFAEVGGAGEAEAPGLGDGLGNADTGANEDGFGVNLGGEEDKRRIGEGQAVEFARDPKGLAEAAGAGTHIVVTAASAGHFGGAELGREGADEDGVAGGADDFDTPVEAIAAVDIGMAGWAKHRAIAGG